MLETILILIYKDYNLDFLIHNTILLFLSLTVKHYFITLIFIAVKRVVRSIDTSVVVNTQDKAIKRDL